MRECPLCGGSISSKSREGIQRSMCEKCGSQQTVVDRDKSDAEPPYFTYPDEWEEETAYIPTLAELAADFREMEGVRFPRLNALIAKSFGLFLTYVMRKQVCWDPEREAYLQ